jgi:hypothetical protein
MMVCPAQHAVQELSVNGCTVGCTKAQPLEARTESVLCKFRLACGATDKLSQPAITRDTPVPVIPGTDEYRFTYWGYSMGGPPTPVSR